MHLGNICDDSVENGIVIEGRVEAKRLVTTIFCRWDKAKSLIQIAGTRAEMMERHWEM